MCTEQSTSARIVCGNVDDLGNPDRLDEGKFVLTKRKGLTITLKWTAYEYSAKTR